jgi:molybdopterin molybdotransferase
VTHDWPDARTAAYAAATPVNPVRADIADALAGTLAEPLIAATPLPPFDTAAMDGYAVAGDPPWQVTGVVLAGQPQPVIMQPGHAVEIATGALVPPTAAAVIPYEKACRTGDSVTGSVREGQHIRRTGEQFARGAVLAPAGEPITPALLGLAASTGADTLLVRPRPRITAVIIGNEVRTSGLPGGAAIRDAIGPMLPGLVAALGGELVETVRLADDAADLRALLDRAATEIVLTAGASSVGRADIVPKTLTAMNARMLVHGVACRPGHPQILAGIRDTWVVALPGNPYAAVVAAHTLLAPLIAGLAGRALPRLPEMPLHGRIGPHPTLTRLIPVRWAGAAVEPVGTDRPASLQGAAMADAIAVLPPGWTGGPVQLLLTNT